MALAEMTRDRVDQIHIYICNMFKFQLLRGGDTQTFRLLGSSKSLQSSLRVRQPSVSSMSLTICDLKFIVTSRKSSAPFLTVLH